MTLQICSICKNIIKKENSTFCTHCYYEKNKEQIILKNKEWAIKNKEYLKQWYKNNYEKNKEQILLKQKENYEKNKEQIKVRYEKDKEYYKKRMRQYVKSEKFKNYLKQYRRKRYQKDINFKIITNLRTRIFLAIKNNSGNKAYKTEFLLGCSIEYLKKYLQNLFKDNMSWKNYGKWHIDHIMPCANFDLTKEEEQKKCFHYSNLQPLWAQENWNKNFKI